MPYANYGGGGSTSGENTTLDLALQLAGFVNVAAEAGIQGSGNLTIEQIFSLEFDAVLALGPEDMKSALSAESLAGATALAGVAPIQERRFIIPGGAWAERARWAPINGRRNTHLPIGALASRTCRYFMRQCTGYGNVALTPGAVYYIIPVGKP